MQAAKTKPTTSAFNVKRDTKLKAKPKPPTNTLDRWFKPAISTAIENPTSQKLQDPVVAKSSHDDENPVAKKNTKVVGTSRKFSQRYICVRDECRVCLNAKTEEVTRCELRCATCSMTVHKKCYSVKEVPDGDWNCRRCQFIYDSTAWEDISSLVGVSTPEGVMFPTCKPLNTEEKFHELQTDCNFAAVFLFLQRFRRLGMKLSNVVTTLENLANALLDPRENTLCAELHCRLLTNIQFGMSKKYPWYINLLRFLRDVEYASIVINEFTTYSSDEQKQKALYFDLSLAERVAILKFLCEIQFDRNDTLVQLIDDEDADSLRYKPIGVDAVGRSYFILEDTATTVWVCRCANGSGTDWETICNNLASLESLVEQLSLSDESTDLQLWQALSRGVLKKLTRHEERRNRSERWKHELALSGVQSSLDNSKCIGRRSLRNREQVNYAKIYEEEEEIISDANNNGDEVESAFEDDDVDSMFDEDRSQCRRSTRNLEVQVKKRKSTDGLTYSTKRRGHSVIAVLVLTLYLYLY
ncbi:hypothetical protein PsorP6_000934 [Peronosclerospora sorghi]|uniref:Uncharacterized protein n=1 Tax=Peronosclerospora sorghi TaxID=230839 RepID=A0ACC0WVW1_9STRA|nr:hypothetical protein PsorP6_000934 [Peronosclerospora sorghi]